LTFFRHWKTQGQGILPLASPLIAHIPLSSGLDLITSSPDMNDTQEQVIQRRIIPGRARRKAGSLLWKNFQAKKLVPTLTINITESSTFM
jgi:hypothetical protein